MVPNEAKGTINLKCSYLIKIDIRETISKGWFKQYLFEFNTGICYIDIQTIHIEDMNESLRLI